jgi:hypothetical protein
MELWARRLRGGMGRCSAGYREGLGFGGGFAGGGFMFAAFAVGASEDFAFAGALIASTHSEILSEGVVRGQDRQGSVRVGRGGGKRIVGVLMYGCMCGEWRGGQSRARRLNMYKKAMTVRMRMKGK